MKIKRIAYIKNNNSWDTVYIETNAKNVYESLSNDVISKKINKCGFIKSIKRKQCYTHVEITVFYNEKTKSVYYLPTNF